MATTHPADGARDKGFTDAWRPLQQIAAWLAGQGVTDAAMESTEVYWWPGASRLSAGQD